MNPPSKTPFTIDIRLRSSVMEDFFGVARTTLHRLEESGDIRAINETYGSAGRHVKYYDSENIRKIIHHLNKKPKVGKPYTYACWHNKGGVGKSTLVFQLSTMMATLMGLKVLVIDTDGQSDSTYLFNAQQTISPDTKLDDFEEQAGLADIIGGLLEKENHNAEFLKTTFERARKHVSAGLDLIPSDERLIEIDYDIRTVRNAGLIKENQDGQLRDISSVALFRFFLEYVEDNYDYDVILIDCSPDLGDKNINVLFAANCLLTPVELEPKAPHSLRRVYNRLGRLKKIHESFGFEKMIVVPNRNERHDVKSIVHTRIRDMYTDNVSKVSLTRTTTLEKGLARNIPIFCFNDESAPKWQIRIPPTAKRLTNELWTLCHELLELPTMDVSKGLFQMEEV